MSITVTAPVAIVKRIPTPAFLAASKANMVVRQAASTAKLDELVKALEALTPLVDGVGPSIIVTEKYTNLVVKAAKLASLKIKKSRIEGDAKGWQVWVR